MTSENLAQVEDNSPRLLSNTDMNVDTVKADYSKDRVRTRLENTENAPKSTTATAHYLSKAFAEENVKSLDSILKQQSKRLDPDIYSPEDIAKATPFVQAVRDLVGEYKSRMQEAYAKREAQAAPVEPVSAPPQALPDEQAVVQNAQAQQAQTAQQAINDKRHGILANVMRNPDISNHFNEFETQLKDAGLDHQISDNELAAIKQFKSEQERTSNGLAPTAAPEAEGIATGLKGVFDQLNATTAPDSVERLIAKEKATVDAITKAMSLDGSAETDGLNAIKALVGDASFAQAEQEHRKMVAAAKEAATATPATPKTETTNATEEGQKPKSRQRKYQGTSEVGPTAETSSSDSAEPVAEEVKPPVQRAKPSAPRVIKAAEEKPASTPPKRPKAIPKDKEVAEAKAAEADLKENEQDAKENFWRSAEIELTGPEGLELNKVVLDETKTLQDVKDELAAIKERAAKATTTPLKVEAVQPTVAKKPVEAVKGGLLKEIGQQKAVFNKWGKPRLTTAEATALRERVEGATSAKELDAIRSDMEEAIKTNMDARPARASADPKAVAAALAKLKVKPKTEGFFQKREGPSKRSTDRSPIPPRIYNLFRAEMDRMGLADVGLRIIRQMEGLETFGQDVNGHYDDLDRVITVVFQGDGAGFYTLSHEIVHALEDVGLIKPEEKTKILEWAKAIPALKEFIDNNYGDLTDAEKDSEYVAQAYAYWLEGKANAPTPSLVSKFFQKVADALDAVRRMVFRSGFKTADDVFKAIYRGDTAKRTHGESTLGKTAGGNLQAATNDAYKDASRLAAENIGGVGNRIASATVIANKLIDMAVKAGIPSARKLERLLAEQGSVIARLDRTYENMSDRFDGLKNAAERGVGKGTANGFIQNMVFDRDANNKPSRMWGFDPNYTNKDGSKVEVQINPELKKQFDALSPEAQQIIRDVFKTSRDNLYAKKKVVMEAFASEYDALIKDAKERGDTKDVAKYENQKKRDISKYDRLMKIDPNLPYAPIKRFGDFVVVGRSKEYLEAEANAEREKTPEAWEALRKMQEDGEHYFVDYAQTRLEAQTMRDKIAQNYEHPDFFRKDEASNAQMGGSSMFGAFQRMQKLIQEQGGAIDPAIRKHLNALSTELYLQTLAASSSRKAEMTRRLVHAGDLDMVRGAIAQGRSDARFIGTIKKNGEIADTLKAMSREAKGNRMNSDKAREIMQQITARHAANLAPVEQNALIDKVLSFTTGQYLVTSPMFFVQQTLQNAVITVPVAAAKHGYARTFAALQKGYQTVGDAWSGADVSKPLDLDKLKGVDRVLALFLSDRNALDVGIDKDMGNWTSGVNNPTSSAIQSVMKKIGGVTRKLEAINRLSSGKMMFELESEKATASNVDPEAYASYLEDFKETHPDLTPFTEKQFVAANEALRIVMDTHGDYSMASSPTWMRGSFGRVLTQFKKFQIMQLSLYTQAINNAFFDKGIPAAEKEVARKTLLYMTGHAALFAGALGVPGAGMGEWLWEAINKLMGREGPFTAESDLRKAIGNDQLANLLLNGAPTLAGIDLSGSLGQGNLLSIAPYAQVPENKATYEDFVTQMLGPAIGGVGMDYAKAIGFMATGQYYKGLEKMLPKGVSNIVKAFRESSEGVSNTGGDVTVSPDKISTGASLATALGIRTTDVSDRQFRQGQAIEITKYFQDQATTLKRDYIAAASKKDGSKMQELRQKWIKVQAQRAEAGLARQPLSQLVKAPRELAKREKNVIGGVQFTKSTRRMAEKLAEETGEEEE